MFALPGEYYLIYYIFRNFNKKPNSNFLMQISTVLGPPGTPGRGGAKGKEKL